MNRRGADRTGPLGGAGLVGLWGAPSLIRSVQYGSATIGATVLTGTATITAVDTANAALLFNGNTTNDGTNGQIDAYQTGTLALTNATTVTATRYTTDNNQNVVVSFCVLEFMPGIARSIQQGTITLTNGVTSNTATITSVNTAKSCLFYNGKQSNQGPLATGANHWTQATLTNATTVTASRNSGSNLEQPAFVVVEFF